MKKTLLTGLFLSIVILLLYQLVNIRLFTLDINRNVSNSLQRSLRDELYPDNNIILFNTGRLSIEEINKQVDSLLSFYPKMLGVNLCHLPESERKLFRPVKGGLVLCDCNTSPQASSIIVGDGNIVTHFRSDSSSYFEIKVSSGWLDLAERKNEIERINYRYPMKSYIQIDLKNADGFDPEFIQGKIILIGFMGEAISEEIVDYQNTRITPLNDEFGDNYISPDMYDIQISANIVSMIIDKEFIGEASPIIRVGTILLFSFVNLLIVSFLRSRYIFLTILFQVIWFVILLTASGYLMVYLFWRNYYIEMNELPLILIITTIMANFIERKPKAIA